MLFKIFPNFIKSLHNIISFLLILRNKRLQLPSKHHKTVLSSFYLKLTFRNALIKPLTNGNQKDQSFEGGI